MERKNIAHRFGPRVSNFLSYRIVVFIKIHDFRHSWIFHGSHGDPMGPHGTHGNPWIFHGFSGRPRERPTKNVGGCGGGREPPPRISRPGSLGRAHLSGLLVQSWPPIRSTPPHPTQPRRFRISNGRSRLSTGRSRISNGRSRIAHVLAAAPRHFLRPIR